MSVVGSGGGTGVGVSGGRPPVLLVSHLASRDGVTGAERSLLSLAAGLRTRGRQVILLSPEEGRSVDEARELGIEARVQPWPRLFLAAYRSSLVGTLGRSLRYGLGRGQVVALGRRLAALGPAVVLVNTLVNLAAVVAARHAGLPVVWRVAELPGPGPRRRFFRHQIERLPQAVVTVSRAVAEAIGAPAAEVIHTGVAEASAETVTAARRELRLRLGLDPEALLVGHVGQLRPHKGQLEFVRAALAIGPPGRAAHFVIAGSESDEPSYARRLHRVGEGLGGRLRFSGFVPGAGTAVAGLDLLVFSATAPDPFPRVVLEAMAAGVPTVAFALGGVVEAVATGETGILVPPGDETALAEAMASLLSDPDRRRRLGAAARIRAARDFGLDPMVDAYARVLDRVASLG